MSLFSGEHHSADFARLNPNKCVPVLEEDGFVLTESSAILKYLADRFQHPAYPADLHERARVNERMDWFQTFFQHDVCYALVYPYVVPDYARLQPQSPEMIAWRTERAHRRLGVLDKWLDETAHVAGPRITIADYHGVCLVTLGELVDFDLSRWPNVRRWVATMKALRSWDEVHAAFYGWRSAVAPSFRLSA